MTPGQRSAGSSRSVAPTERAALVGLLNSKARRLDPEHLLDELAGLADAAGAGVVLRVLQDRPKPDPATFLGKGKLATLAAACEESRVDVVIFDNELSPAQLRNLEGELHRKVVDRTQLILDIFARRARTREGKLQVELAQLRYLLPRLVGAGDALSRLGGGIGTRGPGETKLETDRRRIRQRVGALTQQLDDVRRRRAQLRERRQKSAIPTVALVGYTNAGKTTLFNVLTGQSADVSDALFVTLDPLIRQVRLPDRRELLVSDTVGFIDRLPHTLVAAFRATLEEAAKADLLLHVIDAASPDRERHAAAVRAVLTEIDAADVPRLELLNKCDLLSPVEIDRVRLEHPGALTVSALRVDGIEELRETLAARLALDTCRATFSFDASAAHTREAVSRLYRTSRVLRHVTSGTRILIEADVPRRLLHQLEGRDSSDAFPDDGAAPAPAGVVS